MQPQPPVAPPPPSCHKPSSVAPGRSRQYFLDTTPEVKQQPPSSPPQQQHGGGRGRGISTSATKEENGVPFGGESQPLANQVSSRSASSSRASEAGVSPPPPRRSARLAGLRRNSSFTRYNTIPQQADAWFRNNALLHSELLKFIDGAARREASSNRHHELFAPSYLAFEYFKTHKKLPLNKKSCPPLPEAPKQGSSSGSSSSSTSIIGGADISFSVGIRGQRDVSVVAVAHESQDLFVKFCDLFETQLECNFLPNVRSIGSRSTAAATTSEQFMATMQLHAAEEETDGSHFDRWLEVTELDVFIEYCQAYYTFNTYFSESAVAILGAYHPVSSFLVYIIDDISNEARFQHCKRSLLEPMMIQWSPLSFSEGVLPALDAFLAYTKQKHINKARLRQLLRWKLVLGTKVLGAGGVMVEQPLDGDACNRYVMMFCDAYGVKVDTEENDVDEGTETAGGGGGSISPSSPPLLPPSSSHTVNGLVKFILHWADEDEAKRPKSRHTTSLSMTNRHVKRVIWEIFSALKHAEATMITTKQPAAFASSVSLDLLLASVSQLFQFWFLLGDSTLSQFTAVSNTRNNALGSSHGVATAAIYALLTKELSEGGGGGGEWLKACPSDVIPVPQPWKIVSNHADLPASLSTSSSSSPTEEDLQPFFNLPSKTQQKIRLRATNYLKSEGCISSPQTVENSSNVAKKGGGSPCWRIETLDQLHYILMDVILHGRGIVTSMGGEEGGEEPVVPAAVMKRAECLHHHVFTKATAAGQLPANLGTVVSVANLLARFIQQKQQSQLRLRQLNLLL